MGKDAPCQLRPSTRLTAFQDLPSPEAWTDRISKSNDGSEPYEPYQRGSQSLFEAYLRRTLEASPMVDVRYGVKFESLEETEDGVTSSLTDDKGAVICIKSRYLIGCDGGGSRVRRCLGIESIGGPAYANYRPRLVCVVQDADGL